MIVHRTGTFFFRKTIAQKIKKITIALLRIQLFLTS